jgi:hypothetical protein
MKIKTFELKRPALDWAVAHCEGLLAFGYRTDGGRFAIENSDGTCDGFMPSTNWSEGGPIIEREGIMFEPLGGINICAYLRSRGKSGVIGLGESHLTAAMRCHVASQLGGEVDVPVDLTLGHLI